MFEKNEDNDITESFRQKVSYHPSSKETDNESNDPKEFVVEVPTIKGDICDSIVNKAIALSILKKARSFKIVLDLSAELPQEYLWMMTSLL